MLKNQLLLIFNTENWSLQSTPINGKPPLTLTVLLFASEFKIQGFYCTSTSEIPLSRGASPYRPLKGGLPGISTSSWTISLFIKPSRHWVYARDSVNWLTWSLPYLRPQYWTKTDTRGAVNSSHFLASCCGVF